MNAMWKKLLSLLLVLTMLVGLTPAVFASEEAPAEPEEQEELFLPEEAEEAEEPIVEDEFEAAEPEMTEEPGGAAGEPGEEPAEEPDAEEPAEETEEGEEALSPLPCGFPGMGEDYELSEEELAAKLAIAGLPEAVAALTPGVDYVEGELIIAAGSEAYAQRAADAYDAELVDFDRDFALLSLRGATVLQAVECAADPAVPLPAAAPNYIAQSSFIPGEDIPTGEFEVQGERQDWQHWVDEDMVDPWVTDVSNSRVYQYHHDVLGDYAAWGVGMGQKNASEGVEVAVISYAHDEMLAELIGGRYCDGDGVGVAPLADVDTYIPSQNTAYYYGKALLEVPDEYKIILLDAAFPVHAGFPEDNYYLRNRMIESLNNGRLFIVPMGDNGACCRCYPCFMENDRIIAVAATNPDGTRAVFSNYGDWCDISAPGIAPVGDNFYSGTSYAAALVAGAAALYVGVYGRLYGYDNAVAAFPAAVKQAAAKGGPGAGTLNTANLFALAAPDTPEIDLDYSEGYILQEDNDILNVSEDARLIIYSAAPGDNVDLYYTADGSTPAVKNGKLTHGEPIIDETLRIDELNLPLNKVSKLKVIAVNGLGVPSKVFTRKVRLVESSRNEDLIAADPYGVGNSSENPLSISAGGSYTLKAEVRPKDFSGYKVTRTIKWAIENQYPADLSAKIDAKTGRLTTKAGKTGTIVVSAFHPTEDGGSILFFYIEATTANKVKTITANKKTIKIDRYYGLTSEGNTELFVAAKDAAGSPLAIPADVMISWSSSNTDVVGVDPDYHGPNPTLFPWAKGTATVKGTAMDGSGKSVSVKVTVVQHATDLSVWWVSDHYYLAPGGSMRATGYTLPTDAVEKEIVYSIRNAYGNDVKISQKGVLSMPKNAKIVSPKIEVAASLKSNPSKSYYTVVFLHAAATDLNVYAKNQPFLNSVKWDKDNNVKSVTLLTTDIPTTAETENVLGLDLAYEDTEGNINFMYDDFSLYHSSNENVATVEVFNDDNPDYAFMGILARGPGSCKITVTTEDGMKKHTFTVKVVAPVGNIQLGSAAPNGTNAVAYGKSFKLSARAFDTYGKPTSTKLRWEIAKVMNNFGDNVEPSEYGKVLSISQSGVVTVKKGAANLNLRYIRVTASPAGYLPYDGTEIGGSFWIYITDPIRKIEIGSYPVFALDPDTPTFSGLVKLNDETLQIDTNWKQLISVTSSKPKLVRAWLQQDSYGRYFVYLEARAADFPEKKATVTITVKANDGYGKSASFKVTLQKP